MKGGENEMTKGIFDFTEDDKVGNLKFHNFDEAPEIMGVLLEINEGQYGKQFVMEAADGKKILIGSYIAINDKFTDDDVGKAVKITYKGEIKGKNSKKTYKAFDVFKKSIKANGN
jgi:hypothetical protein